MTFRQIACIAAIAFPCFSFAQRDISITETTKGMSAGSQNCYVMLIPQTTAKSLTDDWKKYVKKDAKGKTEDNNGEIKVSAVFSKNISRDPLNIYASILETSEGIQVSAWFSEGDAFISTAANSDKSVAIQNYMHNFAVQEYKKAVQAQLDAEKSKQRDLEDTYDNYIGDQKKAETNIKSHNKDIEKLQNKIADEQQNIQKAQSNQAMARADADRQKIKVQQVTETLNNIK